MKSQFQTAASDTTKTTFHKADHFRTVRLRILSSIEKAEGVLVCLYSHDLHVCWGSIVLKVRDTPFGLKTSFILDLMVIPIEGTLPLIKGHHILEILNTALFSSVKKK